MIGNVDDLPVPDANAAPTHMACESYPEKKEKYLHLKRTKINWSGQNVCSGEKRGNCRTQSFGFLCSQVDVYSNKNPGLGELCVPIGGYIKPDRR